MDWKEAASYYESRLSDALSVYRHATSLADLPQAQVPSKLIEKLRQEEEPTRCQLERLKKREFRIAVVGLEKAGKSTFINAWLECDLLPSKAARCTFTTTQLYSVINDSDQRLEVITKTEEQFSRLIHDLQESNSQEDLKTINQHEETLSQVRREGNSTYPFTRLEDVKDRLRKYVADERYAHSVHEVRLYTNKLAQAEGIVFYDVPGLDSGLTKHVDEARQMLSDCDAVILVQRFTSLREKEYSIIEFTELGDKNVTVADKLFVFLSRIDSEATPESLKQHLDGACADWFRHARLPQKRIVSGSAGAYLVLNDLAEPETQQQIGSKDSITRKLSELTGISDSELLKTETTGIPVIKEKIFKYINTERVDILKKRCDAFTYIIFNNSEEIYHLVKRNFPENPEEAQKIEENKKRILLSEWWNSRWSEIKAELQQFYDSQIINKPTENVGKGSLSSIDKFKERYLDLVRQEMSDLRSKTLEKKDIIFAANSFPNFDPVEVNYIWRGELYGNIRLLLDNLARQLAAELKDEALQLIDYMSDLLWGSSEVKLKLIGNSDEDFLARLEHSLSVLFLRFARPVAEALIRGPVQSETRSQIVKSLGEDIELMDIYYHGDEQAFQSLKKFAKYGSKLLFDSETRRSILGISDIASNTIIAGIERLIDLSVDKKEPKDIVTFEVVTDLCAFEEYLQNGIFEAAGFESYCIQELRGLIDLFRDKDGTWSGVVVNEWLQENPKLLEELPIDLKSQEFNLEVSNRLKQLAISLNRNTF